MRTLTLHNITMTDNQEIAPGLFAARDNLGTLRVHNGVEFRGYAGPWSRGRFQAQAWGAVLPAFRRTGYTTRRGAERALIREALKRHA